MIWNRFFYGILVFACLLIMAWAVAHGLQRHTLKLSAANQSSNYLFIERGSGLIRIAYEAKRIGLVKQAWHFTAAAKLVGVESRLQAGEYEIPVGLSLRQLIEKIASGDVHYRKLSIAEGLSVAQIEALMVESEGIQWEQYEAPYEGSLFPETYYYSRGEQAQAIVERMQRAMNAELTRLWNARSEGLPLKSPQEALILASIVEKETGAPEERALVAGVFLNRLRRGMRLQSDPTVVYGITSGTPLGRRLTRADLREETAFNTYRINGLPPTAIANPGRAALEAVLQPAETDYLYFVADGTGGHAFAKTLREHNRNVARWRRIRDR